MKNLKKIGFAVLSGLLLITTNIYANPDDQVQEISNGDPIPTANIELYAVIESNYTVSLPKQVDVTDEETTFNIKVKGDIASNQKIMVYVPETATLVETDKNGTDLTQGAHEDITLSIEYDKASTGYEFDDINVNDYEGQNAAGEVTITHAGNIPAGHWQTNLPIKIGLEEITDGE